AEDPAIASRTIACARSLPISRSSAFTIGTTTRAWILTASSTVGSAATAASLLPLGGGVRRLVVGCELREHGAGGVRLLAHRRGAVHLARVVFGGAHHLHQEVEVSLGLPAPLAFLEVLGEHPCLAADAPHLVLQLVVGLRLPGGHVRHGVLVERVVKLG